MPERQRSSPEKMLMRAHEEETQLRGKLKIYLGAAPGVGKTHTMLSDALAKREQGLDVVAGVVESHGRKEIDALLQGLEILPRKIVDYHGKPLLEFDLDGAINRNPGLILIDEMAHTNIPGLRHAKRWQDIKELLDRGIDVYTTLNVQHIESLNNVITQVTNIKVRETVPDSTLELADTIELVDLPPDDLLKRLQEGKVYIPAQAELATQNFFRKGNLTALREMALRYTAEHVEEQVLRHRRGQGIEQTWPTSERLLVCIGPGAASTKVVRAAKRLATSLHAEWIAVHVEVPNIQLTDEQKQSAILNLRLAEQLGAETRVLNALDVVKEIMTFAHDRNVTKIVMGKHPRSRWKEFLFGSLAEELVRQSGDIDVYIIRGDTTEDKKINLTNVNREISWTSYLLAIIGTSVATSIGWFIYPFVGLVNVLMLYLLCIVFLALKGRTGPAMFMVFISVLSFTFFFLPPPLTFQFDNLEYLFTFFVMGLVTYLISTLTIITREQSEIAYIGEQRTAALHTLTRQLASTRGINRLLDIALTYISRVFNSEVLALLPEEGHLKIHTGVGEARNLSPKDEGVAQWVHDIGQAAGLGTDTLPFSDSVYVPMLGSHGTVGVLKVRPRDKDRLLIPEQLRLLEACANQLALALEVDRLQEKAKETQIAIETERLRTALFSSVSHELETPLAMIVRLVDALSKRKSLSKEEETNILIKDLSNEAGRINRLINNLVQITQLEEGKIQLHKQLNSIPEVVKLSLARVEKRLGNKPYKLQIPSDIPLFPFDKVLMEQVFVNLIENAILYTPTETPIEIAVVNEEGSVVVSVADRGPGLLLEDVEKVFEKFYRGHKDTDKTGSGLGLSVCESIIKAHNGRIWAENRWDGGAIFYFVLPEESA